MRTYARECVFKYIFARLFNPSDEGLFAVLCKDFKEDDKKFADELLNAVDLPPQGPPVITILVICILILR